MTGGGPALPFYRGDPHDLPWRVYPAGIGGDPGGLGRIVDLTNRVRPDVVLLVIDPWIETRHVDLLTKEVPSDRRPKIVSLVLVESDGGDSEWFSGYEVVQKVVTTSRSAASIITAMDPALAPKVEVIPFGVDLECFLPLSGGPQAAKKKLGLDPEGFVVLNANRNQPRKRIDITVKGFSLFAQGKPENVKLWLHMGLRDTGWDVVKLARAFGVEEGLILSDSGGTEIPDLRDEDLNTIYNACDVGVNTACCEGWGLVAFEHAAAGAAQVMTDLPTQRSTWSESAVMIPADKTVVFERTHFNAHLADERALAGILERLYLGAGHRKRVGEACRANALRPEYDWDSIGEKWDLLLRSVV